MGLLVRRAIEADFESIVDLQMRNLVANLTPEERSDGFLSGYFDAQALRATNENLAVVGCFDGEKTVGFICLTTPSFKYSNDVAVAMLDRVKDFEIFGKPFHKWSVCLCGPVCIEKEYRGTGAFATLYEHISQYAEGCDLLLTLIAKNNLRSIGAHRKVGQEPVADFAWNNRSFLVLARLP